LYDALWKVKDSNIYLYARSTLQKI